MGRLAHLEKPAVEFHSVICPEMNLALLLIPWATTLLPPVAVNTMAIDRNRGTFG
jgi:hypothetical protein